MRNLIFISPSGSIELHFESPIGPVKLVFKGGPLFVNRELIEGREADWLASATLAADDEAWLIARLVEIQSKRSQSLETVVRFIKD